MQCCIAGRCFRVASVIRCPSLYWFFPSDISVFLTYASDKYRVIIPYVSCYNSQYDTFICLLIIVRMNIIETASAEHFMGSFNFTRRRVILGSTSVAVCGFCYLLSEFTGRKPFFLSDVVRKIVFKSYHKVLKNF